jgi:hypothetical protein
MYETVTSDSGRKGSAPGAKAFTTAEYARARAHGRRQEQAHAVVVCTVLVQIMERILHVRAQQWLRVSDQWGKEWSNMTSARLLR